MTEDVELRGARGIRLAAERFGRAGRTVLLVHGGGQTKHAWERTARSLAGEGHQAISMDLRGHGDSDWDPDGDYRFDAFVDDIAAVSRTLPEPVLVGASVGGLASLVAVAQGTSAAGLVLVDVAARIEPMGVARIRAFMARHAESGFGSLSEAADAVAAYNPHRPRQHDLAGIERNLRSRGGRWYWHWDPRFLPAEGDEVSGHGEPARLRDAARSLRVPTLIIRGAHSDVLSEEGAAEMAALIPDATLVEVAGAGHMVAGDRNDRFSAAVLEFLQRLSS